MKTIAKFKCVEKAKNQYNEKISLEPVTSGSPENDEFYKTTPSGVIHIFTCNPQAADSFEVGKEYYVNFSPAN
ncbi:MAG: hypothetical protein M0P47_09380 [Bacteroidales bacterium]|nr:hypothetical protein [Bacteroidales bacterium]